MKLLKINEKQLEIPWSVFNVESPHYVYTTTDGFTLKNSQKHTYMRITFASMCRRINHLLDQNWCYTSWQATTIGVTVTVQRRPEPVEEYRIIDVESFFGSKVRSLELNPESFMLKFTSNEDLFVDNRLFCRILGGLFKMEIIDFKFPDKKTLLVRIK